MLGCIIVLQFSLDIIWIGDCLYCTMIVCMPLNSCVETLQPIVSHLVCNSLRQHSWARLVSVLFFFLISLFGVFWDSSLLFYIFLIFSLFSCLRSFPIHGSLLPSQQYLFITPSLFFHVHYFSFPLLFFSFSFLDIFAIVWILITLFNKKGSIVSEFESCGSILLIL